VNPPRRNRLFNALLHPSPGTRSRLCQILLVLVIAYGALLRVDRLFSYPDFVSPDALRHFIAAEELRADDPLGWFSVYRGYAPFAWVLRLFFGVTSHQPVIQRLVTVLFSVVLLFLVARIVRARLGEWMGLFAAYLTAINPALIESADSGIREDPYAVLWLTLFFLVFVWRPEEAPRASLRRAAIGLVACLTFLMRVDSLLPLAGSVVLALLANGFWRKRGEWFEAMAPFAVLLGIVLLANGARHDDSFYFVDREKNMFRYWANLEFKGRPGFPTVEEVSVNSRTGEPLSAFQYFGGVLGWKETVSRYFKGYMELLGKNVFTGIYRFNVFPNHISLVGLLTLLGLASELFRKRWVIPILIPLLFSGTAWTYNIVGGHDFRFFLVAVPFAIIAASEGVFLVAGWIRCIPYIWLRGVAGVLILIPVLMNPWNHDLKTSFPWRVGPAGSVPLHCMFDSGQPDRVPSLVGVEYRGMGPLGFLDYRLTCIKPGHRFLVRTWWRVPRIVAEEVSYRVVVYKEDMGYLSGTRYQPLTRKFPIRNWRPDQTVMDETECLVYKRQGLGEAEVRIEIKSNGLVEDATYTTVFTLQ
jgi:hypothetical protein